MSPLRARLAVRLLLSLSVACLTAPGPLGLGPILPPAPDGRTSADATIRDPRFLYDEDGIVRGDVSKKELALIFTGGDFADGGPLIRAVLSEKGVKAGFFFTGDFYGSGPKRDLVRGLVADGHYLGPHSDKHLLYCDWEDRSKTLVARDAFESDILANYAVMAEYGIRKQDAPYFIPPYEWYNREIVAWSERLGLILFNFTPGTSSNADYTTPDMSNYLSSDVIYDRILAYEEKDPNGLNGFILLIHIGTDPGRTDKLYARLGELIDTLRGRGYAFVRIDELLAPHPPDRTKAGL
jgi:endoglucanase